jgi:hypothetical protein
MFEIINNSIMKIIPETANKTISMAIFSILIHFSDLNLQLENTLQFAKC